MRRKLGYCVSRQDSHGYAKLYVNLFGIGPDALYGTTMEFSWQGDSRPDDPAHPWYAGHMMVEARNAEDFTNAAAIMSRMHKAQVALNWPDEVIAELEHMGMKRLYYDTRLWKHRFIDDQEPGDRWMDAYIDYGYSSCAVACIAETESQAQNRLLIEFAEWAQQTGNSDTRTRLANWIRADMPVKMSDLGPVIYNLQKLLDPSLTDFTED